MSYSIAFGKTLLELEKELTQVYYDYPDYCGCMTLKDMIKKFAEDDFYKLHYVAKRYLELRAE